MKIGIYNRYWNTYGGGERYIGAIAEVMAEDNEVELISIEHVDWAQIESRLSLDLSKCKKIQWPSWPCEELSPLSGNYDLFVNSTYGSAMLPQSKKSILICFFPQRIDLLSNKIRSIKLICKKLFHRITSTNSWGKGKVIRPISGFYDVECNGGVWAQRFSVLSIANSQLSQITIPLWPDSYNRIKDIRVEGKSVNWQLEGDDCFVTLPIANENPRTLTIEAVPMDDLLKPADTRELALYIDTRRIALDKRAVIIKNIFQNISHLKSLASYDRIISISQFTTKWITKRWNLPSHYLPPPIDTKKFTFDPNQTRESIIISVGRFFAGGHNKKHHEMAKAFIRMRKEGLIPLDWRLILVGSRHLESSRHIDYFESLLNLCKGHPIEILSDLPFSELLLLYRKASIYWHATGWGVPANTSPERQEHFGITTCEAMASGCVPVVFDAAGQKEIVNSNLVGFRYADYPSLAEQMRFLTNASDKTLSDLGWAARRSISRYALSDFPEKVKKSFSF